MGQAFRMTGGGWGLEGDGNQIPGEARRTLEQFGCALRTKWRWLPGMVNGCFAWYGITDLVNGSRKWIES